MRLVILPSNNADKAKVRGNCWSNSPATVSLASSITHWRKLRKSLQLARAWKSNVQHKQTQTKNPLKYHSNTVQKGAKLGTWRITLRKQLFPRLCRPGTRKESSPASLTVPEKRLRLRNRRAKTRPAKPSRPATDKCETQMLETLILSVRTQTMAFVSEPLRETILKRKRKTKRVQMASVSLS